MSGLGAAPAVPAAPSMARLARAAAASARAAVEVPARDVSSMSGATAPAPVAMASRLASLSARFARAIADWRCVSSSVLARRRTRSAAQPPCVIGTCRRTAMRGEVERLHGSARGTLAWFRSSDESCAIDSAASCLTTRSGDSASGARRRTPPSSTTAARCDGFAVSSERIIAVKRTVSRSPLSAHRMTRGRCSRNSARNPARSSAAAAGLAAALPILIQLVFCD